MKTTYTCYHCAKSIKAGSVTHTNPPMSLVVMGLDFPKSFHPDCYKQSEKEAAKKL